MLQSIWSDVKQQYAYGNMVTKIILVNVAVFVLINLLRLFFFLMGQGNISGAYRILIKYLSVSSDWLWTLSHPWVLVTSIFLHENLFHILWNMIIFYWFGRIVGDFIGNHRVLPLYLMGGIFGALFYLTAATLFSWKGWAYGASAGVMAHLLASATLSPNYEIRLIFLGNVKLKYLAAAIVFIDIISIPAMYNVGGHIAHLGGACFGWLFVVLLRQGYDLSLFFNKIGFYFNQISYRHKKGTHKTTGKSKKFTVIRNEKLEDKELSINSMNRDRFEEKLDMILQKIKEQGYDKLTPEEKEFLFLASKK